MCAVTKVASASWLLQLLVNGLFNLTFILYLMRLEDTF